MTKEIPLTKGKFAIVDDADFERLSEIRWHFHMAGSGYAAGRICQDGEVVSVTMHRLLMNVSAGVSVDHINGDGLDNRRSNLRIATPSENNRNRSPSKGFKGVHFLKKGGGYQASIKFGVNAKYLGCFSSGEAAACAYDYAAIIHFGEFARLNFPNGCPLTVEEVEAKRYGKKSSSQYRGVSRSGWDNRKKRWRATIMIDRKTISLGYFDSEIEAARAYDEAAIKYRGDKAKLNGV